MKRIIVAIALMFALATSALAGPPPALLDINTCSRAELQGVKGLAPYAGQIIAGRPYTGKDQIVAKAGVPAAAYAAVKNQIVAKRPKKVK
jgi:DNA uptake protein ComE-like DNA-binding protein